MEIDVKYAEVIAPVEKVTFTFTPEEALLLKVLTGNIRGGGKLRDLTGNIYHSLDFIPVTGKEYLEAKDQNKHLVLDFC